MTRLPPRLFDGLHGRELLKAIAKLTVPGGEDGECWDWQGGFSSDGPGKRSYPTLCMKVGTRRRTRGVHRVSFEAAFGPLPPGEQVHHRCGRRVCVRPEHLEAVTGALNVAEMLARNSLERRIRYLESLLRDLLPGASFE